MDKYKELLDDEVAPMEILDYFEKKYTTENIVSQKTIYNWLKELGINYINPHEKRNRALRYKKSDVLRLEKEKKERLEYLKQKRIEEYERNAQEEIENYQKFQSERTYETEEHENEKARILIAVEREIKNTKLEMCFSKLFPDVKFDEERLAKDLYIMQERLSGKYSYEEIGRAKYSLENKLYIK